MGGPEGPHAWLAALARDSLPLWKESSLCCQCYWQLRLPIIRVWFSQVADQPDRKSPPPVSNKVCLDTARNGTGRGMVGLFFGRCLPQAVVPRCLARAISSRPRKLG